MSSGNKPPLEDSVQFTFSISTLSTLRTKGLEPLFANVRYAKDQLSPKRVVGYIQVYIFGNKLNSVWSGMCLRKRPTLLWSVGGQDAERVLF